MNSRMFSFLGASKMAAISTIAAIADLFVLAAIASFTNRTEMPSR